MLFNTLDFIVFFPIVLLILVFFKNVKFQHLFLLLASYFFFYFSSNYLITLLIFTTIWDYYFGNLIYKSNNNKIRKAILVVSLAGNLGLLGFFKYADFAITQFNILGQQFNLATQIPMLHIALPIAISFYTFHSITYTVSIYRRQMGPARSFTEYAIFVAFFPQLVAGPILRAKEFLPQLREKLDNLKTISKQRLITIQSSNLKFGITLMTFGFLKKMFFGDNLSALIDDIFVSPIGSDSFTIVLGAIAFGAKIYCDFSGYSDIALGAAAIMGFKIPINFNKPYFATSPSDFWKRWHISLSSWLRDYLYIPLGGNRKSPVRTCFNLMATMFLGGLWHGASWNFVIWGTMHGTYLIIHKIIGLRFPGLQNHKLFKSKIGIIVSILITQYFVFLTWLAFRVQNIDDLLYCIRKYIVLDFQINEVVQVISTQKLSFSILVVFFIMHYISYRTNIIDRFTKLRSGVWFLFLISAILIILLFYDGNPEKFIYFQF